MLCRGIRRRDIRLVHQARRRSERTGAEPLALQEAGLSPDTDKRSQTMTLRTIMSPLALSAAALTIASAALVAPARAQNADGLGPVFFLWGGDKEWGGGRQTVGFNQSFKPGQVVVSFGDRRLYLVTGQGQAISYPIAIPREQSRWEGVTNVSQKRELAKVNRPLRSLRKIFCGMVSTSE